LAQYVAIPGANAVKINSSRESAEVVLGEPLGCIIHSSDAAARANGRYTINSEDPGRRVRAVLICGAGPSGLLFTQYLRNVLGYDGLLIVAEPNRRKRELAAGFGATCVDPDAVDLVKAVQELTKGRRVEYLIEAAGAARLFVQMPGLIRKQATVLLYGHGHSGVDLGVLNSIQFLEPTLVAAAGASGGFDADGRPSTYRRALELIEEGRVKVGDFITHSYDSLEAVRSAFLGDHRRPEYVKGVVSI
jgi:L-iditol 2-dehydrogenase